MKLEKYVAALSIIILILSCNKSESNAIKFARQIVLDRIKTPSTAKWPRIEIIEHSGPFYLVYVVVDAQNTYGAMIRESLIVAFTEIEAEKGCKSLECHFATTFFLNEPDAVIQKVPELSTSEKITNIQNISYYNEKILLLKKLNHWPGYE